MNCRRFIAFLGSQDDAEASIISQGGSRWPRAASVLQLDQEASTPRASSRRGGRHRPTPLSWASGFDSTRSSCGNATDIQRVAFQRMQAAHWGRRNDPRYQP
jgi:hypothetical protein